MEHLLREISCKVTKKNHFSGKDTDKKTTFANRTTTNSILLPQFSEIRTTDLHISVNFRIFASGYEGTPHDTGRHP